MAANRLFKFRTILELEPFLNGAALSGPCFEKQGWLSGIIGKTLIVEGTTVTFVAGSVPPDGDVTALYFKDVKAQIEAAVATVKVLHLEGRVVIIESTITSGVTVGALGTANQNFGFNTAGDTIGKVYSPVDISNTPPTWVDIQLSDQMYVLSTWE